MSGTATATFASATDGFIGPSIIRGRLAHGLDVGGNGVGKLCYDTLEGLWTGVRSFLVRCAVSECFVAQCVPVFQRDYKVKSATDEFMRVLPRILPSTCFP